jgi:AcrR family transcriptional regulator
MDQNRSYHHGRLKEQLIELGERALKENRLHDLSLRELARQAGVSHSAPYRHFSDREALEVALLEKELQHLISETDRIDKAPLTALEKLDRFGAYLIRRSAEAPHRLQLLMRPELGLEPATLKDLKDRFAKPFLRWIVEELHSRHLRAHQTPFKILQTIWALYCGYALLNQSHWSPEDSLKNLSSAIDLVFKNQKG